MKNAYTGNMQYEYSFNDEGMLESKKASGRTLLSYTYDKNNNIKTIKDITGKSSIYSYDETNRVKEIKDDKENTVVTYDYYKNNDIKTISYGNGVKTNYSYDGDGNVESLVTVTSTGEVLVDYNYAYDLNGNRLEKVSSKHKNYYTYDSMNRLKASIYDGRGESFTYDKVGNRISKTVSGITETYVYNVKNQLKELKNQNTITHFTYDNQGNTIKEESNLGTNFYEYNTLNQQVKAITKEGNTLVSRYDTEGLRYEIEENAKLARFIFHKENILVETDKDYNPISRFTRGYEVVAADISDGVVGSELERNSDLESQLNRYYYTQDEQGSTVYIIDKHENIRNEYCYDAFGNVLDSKEELHNRITYTGQQFDNITQQYYLRARFYNPIVGRFTQEDVYRGDGLNLYAYCGNNPVVYYDWSGFAKSKCEPKASAFGEMSKEDAKKYNEYWDNVAASQGKIKDYNKAIKKIDVLGDYYEVKLKYETDVSWGKKIKDMNIDDFNYKSKILQELSDKNQLYKTPSNRNAYITKSYKKYIREDLIKRYKDNPTKLKEELKKLKSMDPDHLWELQLGGLDEFENLEMIDGFTNRRIGQNLGVQMRDVSEGARIKIIIER